MNTNFQNIPDVINMTTMARLLNLSRSRLYQLVEEGILLTPAYLLNRKPVYTRDMVLRNLQVKQNNCGINGQPILFYTTRNVLRRKESTPKVRTSQPRKVASPTKYKPLLDELSTLGHQSLNTTAIYTKNTIQQLSEAYHHTGISVTTA